MKFKSFIPCGLLALGIGAATTSCQDMFTAENNLVTTDLAPKDTLYQVMGIVKSMQKLADRTVLLGEVRGDLVDVNPTVASTYVQQLNNNSVTTDNIYNQPADYYAVINNCNIYLAHVDSLLGAHGSTIVNEKDKYYGREICAVKSFRAWCYLELAKNYGEVPFVTEPVLTADAAENIVANGTKANMKTILDYCINDLAKYSLEPDNDDLRQKYGNITFAGLSFDKFFIPVRALLGELYLWRGTYTGNNDDYVNAIRMYHDYFTYPGEERSVGQYANSGTSYGSVYWAYETPARNETTNGSYGLMTFGATVDKQNAGLIPCDTTTYAGTVSDIRQVFNSQYSNNYYPWVEPSQRLRNISKGQDYCYYKYVNDNDKKSIIFSKDANDYPESNALYVGDLRLSDVYTTRDNQANSQYNSAYASATHYITKWTGGSSYTSTDQRQSYIPLYRTNILYLHLAEALNRAGFPETAFAVLAYGLSYDTMSDRAIISKDEFDRLSEIKCQGFTLTDTYYTGDLANGNNSAACWPHDIFARPNKDVASTPGNVIIVGPTTGNTHVQVGVHSLGSGDTEYNPNYVLNTPEVNAGIKPLINPVAPEVPKYDKKTDDADSTNYKAALAQYEIDLAQYEADLEKDAQTAAANVAYLATPEVRAARQTHVARMILDEQALEGMFEGTRFYDLLRYQMAEGKVSGAAATITLPDYITERYGAMENDKMTGKSWYLPLPKR